MELNFINGKAIIKNGRKVIAKVYYRPEFFKGLNIKWNKEYPFSIEINGLGAECKNIAEVKELFYSEL